MTTSLERSSATIPTSPITQPILNSVHTHDLHTSNSRRRRHYHDSDSDDSQIKRLKDKEIIVEGKGHETTIIIATTAKRPLMCQNHLENEHRLWVIMLTGNLLTGILQHTA